uniref:Uncharacterized protein n=1 Tax=Rhizophagus irregularis (strain DAOM 181602 / DAOM 197198 / MUCL 43194) TaxID=747089 RepID=U9ST78_RHIID
MSRSIQTQHPENVQNIAIFCSLHLPVLFQELSLYKQNTTYNQFYHHGKHKKEKLSHAKLEELVQSLSISVIQPWACSKVWELIIQEQMSGCKKFITARDPTVDLKVYTINSTMHMERYGELSEFLRSKEDYEYVNLHTYIKELQFVSLRQLSWNIKLYLESSFLF